MSHFSVLVIGDDVDAQLAPYHEFECTGNDDAFVQDVDITDELRALMTGDNTKTLEEALEWNGLEDRAVQDESQVDKSDTHKYGYAVVKDGQLIKAVRRTNPNKEWDWWVIGGRWSGLLKLKPGASGELGRKGLMGSCAADGPGRADVATKGDIDFQGMRDDAGNRAAAQWDKANAAAAGRTWRKWEQVRDEDHKGNIEAAREAYHAQAAMQDVYKAMGRPFDGVDQYLVPRDVYVQAARDSACATYALVKNGQWIAKGEMGWFGMSDDKVSQEDWNRKVNELLDSLPDDTVITVVDCHI